MNGRIPDEHFRALLDGLLEGCPVIDPEGRYPYVNDAVARQGRRAKDELIRARMTDLYPGIDQTDILGTLRPCGNGP